MIIPFSRLDPRINLVGIAKRLDMSTILFFPSYSILGQTPALVLAAQQFRNSY